MKNIINKVIAWAKTISVKNWIKIGLIAIVLIGLIVYVSQKKEDVKVDDTKVVATTTTTVKTTPKTTTVVKTVPTVVSNVMNKCNFRVTSPVMYSGVNVPFTVNGILDLADKSKGCMWNMESSRAGVAEIFYNKDNSGWKSAGTSVQIMTSMVPGKATTTLAFSTTFNLYTTALGLKSGTPIKIVFTEYNIPIQTNPDTFDFLVNLK
jgi:hypothetical protein